MPQLPAPSSSRTVAAIFERHVRDAEDWHRDHLGASVIGKPCTRELWYSFRWFTAPEHDGRILRLFERGQREEDWLAEELRAVGVELLTRDQQTGDQFRVSYIGGHFGGSCDGVGRGFVEAPKTWHVWEAKTASKRRFDEVASKGVKDARPEHYAQMQVYMDGLGIDRAYYTCVCKDDDRIYAERVHLDPDHAAAMVARAGAVINSPRPPTRISEDPSWYVCRFCDHRAPCHEGDATKVETNCRTCAESVPQEDGQWWCAHHRENLTPEKQRVGCEDHRPIPGAVREVGD